MVTLLTSLKTGNGSLVEHFLQHFPTERHAGSDGVSTRLFVHSAVMTALFTHYTATAPGVTSFQCTVFYSTPLRHARHGW
ncbi:hypothetical protein ACOMHN_007618 [Nucella lapillus]